MKIVEIFNSIDGEGKRAGELTTFVRLYGCNLSCAYCDSTYAWNNGEFTEMSIDEIIDECRKYNTRNITVTGGEPLIHKDITRLLSALSDEGYNTNVETNGSISINPFFDADGDQKPEYENVWFTVDYKCGASGMSDRMTMDNFIKPYSGTVYKFVVGSESDLDQASSIISNIMSSKGVLDLARRHNYIYLSPVFGRIEPKQIVEYMQSHNMFNRLIPIRVQLQLHKFIWDPMMKGV